MPTDKREFCGSISVRIDTCRRKLELSPAELYGGEEGLYRVRLGRRWIDTPEGKPLFFDRTRLADLLAAHAFGEAAAVLPDKLPDLPRSSRVSVKFWHDGLPRRELSWTASPPWRGFDGRFYVFAMTVAAGFIAVPVDEVEPLRHRNTSARQGANHAGRG
ncbi:MAG: hypothetical protein LBQ51_04755 [Desulfovibrio sp.]|jgi:hypothetical protein|nr:hypothetical protein [Desulfovibrio sp.]